MLGQHPPAPQEDAPGHEAPDWQAKSPDEPLPLPMPIRDISLFVFFEVHEGHGQFSRDEEATISSNTRPHSEH
jgi:hypothetical protein